MVQHSYTRKLFDYFVVTEAKPIICPWEKRNKGEFPKFNVFCNFH